MARRDITTPRRSPISIETKTTVRKVTIHIAASILLNFQKRSSAVICISMPFKATTMTLAKTAWAKETALFWKQQIQHVHTFGNGSKNGPIQLRTITRIAQETIEAI